MIARTTDRRKFSWSEHAELLAVRSFSNDPAETSVSELVLTRIVCRRDLDNRHPPCTRRTRHLVHRTLFSRHPECVASRHASRLLAPTQQAITLTVLERDLLSRDQARIREPAQRGTNGRFVLAPRESRRERRDADGLLRDKLAGYHDKRGSRGALRAFLSLPAHCRGARQLRSGSCIIDGETVAGSEDGIACLPHPLSTARWARVPLRLRSD